MATVLTMTPEEALEWDVQIIAALMRRLNLTETMIRADELPKLMTQSCGLQLVPRDGGVVVILLSVEVTNALADGDGEVRH